jgi:serine/threonine protein phosphatase 1
MEVMEHLTFAIGDIHGRLDLLRAAFEAIEAKAQAAEAGWTIICLGDLVDRGPHSAEVVAFLIAAEAAGVARCIKGNHEDLMLRALRLRDTESADRWIDNGGDATLRSYDASRRRDPTTENLVDSHLDWLEALPAFIEDEHRIYVHAGLDPRRRLLSQDEQTLLWIRERFLKAGAAEFPDAKHIVHGHTPIWAEKPEARRPELLDHRTNLDSGAYMTGVLTVGVFSSESPGGPVEIVQVGA